MVVTSSQSLHPLSLGSRCLLRSTRGFALLQATRGVPSRAHQRIVRRLIFKAEAPTERFGEFALLLDTDG